ncbi:MAG: hypothetical protein LBF68_08560 [Christensenellaceae bacterium]|jgi:CHASE3 domain sensor protein|nr:hypothetical protein [Christensenellaceae bacterium]
MLILIVLLEFFTIVAFVKAIAKPNSQKGQHKIMTSFFGAVLAFFIAQIVVFGGIAISNEILQEVNTATQTGTNL